MITCVYCDRELHHAPTKLGWVDKPGGFGLCFDCIQRCYEVMVAHRNAEAAAVDNGAGEHISQPAPCSEGEAKPCQHVTNGECNLCVKCGRIIDCSSTASA
jgi:hypothetical protein